MSVNFQSVSFPVSVILCNFALRFQVVRLGGVFSVALTLVGSVPSWSVYLMRENGRKMRRREPVKPCRRWDGFVQASNMLRDSVGLRWVLLMLQHLAHSINRPTATDEKKKNVPIFVVISLVSPISGKTLKLLLTDVMSCQNAPNSISAGAAPQTPLVELTALPQTP